MTLSQVIPAKICCLFKTGSFCAVKGIKTDSKLGKYQALKLKSKRLTHSKVWLLQLEFWLHKFQLVSWRNPNGGFGTFVNVLF